MENPETLPINLNGGRFSDTIIRARLGLHNHRTNLLTGKEIACQEL
jgi:hypothetical protein